MGKVIAFQLAFQLANLGPKSDELHEDGLIGWLIDGLLDKSIDWLIGFVYLPPSEEAAPAFSTSKEPKGGWRKETQLKMDSIFNINNHSLWKWHVEMDYADMNMKYKDRTLDERSKNENYRKKNYLTQLFK